MSVPSFLYSGLGPDIRQLNKYLDDMGGGDARTADVEVHCIINPIQSKKDQPTLWKLEQSVGLRDCKNRHAAAADSMKYFPATSIAVTSTDRHVFDSRVSEVSQWLLDGFNALTIAYGEECAGKRAYMLGSPRSHASYVPDVLSQLYGEAEEVPLNIALSLWALRGNDIIDLCEAPNEKQHVSSFATIECPTLDIALKVIHAARQRCRDHKEKMRESDFAHLFIRVLVFRPTTSDSSIGTISHLHVVDLIGLQSTDTLQHRQLPEQDRIARREHSLQLQSLCKVLTEVRDISRAAALSKSLGAFDAKPTEQLRLTSARDSKLTLLLAPIIQGNAKTNIYLFLQDGESHYAQSLHTLCSFEGMTDITSACYRVHDVQFSSLQCKHFDSVLSIAAMLPSARISQRGIIEEHLDGEADECSNEDDVVPPQAQPETKQQNVSNLSASTKRDHGSDRSHFHTLKQEFQSLMADLMQQAVESPDQSPMRRVKGGYSDRHTLDYSSMFHRRMTAIHDESAAPPVPSFMKKRDEEDEDVLNDSLEIPPPPEAEEYNWEKAWQEEDASEFQLISHAPQLSTHDYWPSHEDDMYPPRSTESPLNITPNSTRHRGISFDSPPAPKINLSTTPSHRSEKWEREDSGSEHVYSSQKSNCNTAHSPQRHEFAQHASFNHSSESTEMHCTHTTANEHVHDSLLRTLHEEQQEKEQWIERAKRYEAELEEQKAQFDVERETYRVDELRLKGQIRKLMLNSSIQDAVSVFEHDIDRLTKENEFLKKRNLMLEDRVTVDGTPRKGDIVWNLDGMSSNDGATKEMRVLRARLKKAEKENVELSGKYEELRKKERVYSITATQLDDFSKKYKSLHAEHQQLQQQITVERTAASKKDADAFHLKEELEALQFSERTLREERSRILAELAMLRQRVRECDEDRRTSRSYDRFLHKHGGRSPVRHTSENTAENISSVRDSFEALSGVNGLSNAIYTRPEEVEPLSIALEKALLTLQDNIAIVAPSLLPMVHKLAAEIRNERATSLEQKIQILQKYKNIRGGQNLKPSKTRSSRNASTSDSRYTDRSKLKF